MPRALLDTSLAGAFWGFTEHQSPAAAELAAKRLLSVIFDHPPTPPPAPWIAAAAHAVLAHRFLLPEYGDRVLKLLALPDAPTPDAEFLRAVVGMAQLGLGKGDADTVKQDVRAAIVALAGHRATYGETVRWLDMKFTVLRELALREFDDAGLKDKLDAVAKWLRTGQDIRRTHHQERLAWNEAAGGDAIVRKPGAAPIDLREDGTVSVRLLGPLPSGLAALAAIWPLPEAPDEPEEAEEEPSEVAMDTEPPPDVEALAGADYTVDDTVPNESSIAFVLSHGSRRIPIAADSHAQTLVASIDEDFGGRLEVDVATLPHHGSRRNTSPELAERIVASTWTVSTQGGGKHLFPHGESIARILTRKVPDNRPSFVFNSEHREAWTWNDMGTKKAYGYTTRYPEKVENWVTLSIASKPDPS